VYGTHVSRLIKLHSSSLAVISVLSGMETIQGQYQGQYCMSSQVLT